MGFQISYEAWPCWNPFTIFMTLYVHHTEGHAALDNAQDDQCYLCCSYTSEVSEPIMFLSLRMGHWNIQQTIFWQDSSTLHYYAKIIIHPYCSSNSQKLGEPKKLSSLLRVCRWGWFRVKGSALIILKGLFHLMEKDEMWVERNIKYINKYKRMMTVWWCHLCSLRLNGLQHCHFSVSKMQQKVSPAGKSFSLVDLAQCL